MYGSHSQDQSGLHVYKQLAEQHGMRLDSSSKQGEAVVSFIFILDAPIWEHFFWSIWQTAFFLPGKTVYML